MPTIDYRLKDGTRIQGVTTIISQNLGWNKQALMYWANQEGLSGRNHRDTAQRAADAGIIGHYLIDCDIKGIQPDTAKFAPELLQKGETCFLNFLEWKKMVNLRPVKTEINLVSEKHQFGATPDCVGVVIDKLALVDWNTGGGTYPEQLIQLAAYRTASEGNFSEQPLEGGFHLLRIGKEDASFHHHHWGALPEAWEAFTHLLEIHRLARIIKSQA